MKAMLVTRSVQLIRTAAVVCVAAAAALAMAPGCSGKLDDKECTKLKIESFDVLNKAQHCNNDADCRGSDWPDCGKPLSNTSAGEIKPKADAYFTGKCEEKRPDCTDQTPIYCKQGLCVRKEKSAPDNPGGTSTSDIIVQ